MADKTVVGLDYESYYCSKSGYTLRKMDIPSYLLDQRFETTMVAVSDISTGKSR